MSAAPQPFVPCLPSISRSTSLTGDGQGFWVWLAMPPSTNRLWRMMRGRMVKSPEYREWKDNAIRDIARQLPGVTPMEWFTAAVSLPPTRRDPDNAIKPILDALQAAGAVQDDKRLRCLVLAVDDALEGYCTVQLRIASAPPAKAKKTRKPVQNAPRPHDPNCDHWDRMHNHDCTCGATRPRHPMFQAQGVAA